MKLYIANNWPKLLRNMILLGFAALCGTVFATSAGSIIIADGNQNKLSIWPCQSGEGQGDSWNCQSQKGHSYSCIKKYCNQSYCDFNEDNLCYLIGNSHPSPQPGTSEPLPQEQADWGFLFMSDIHGGRHPALQRAVRDAMQDMASQDASLQLILNGGDNSSHGLKPGFVQTYIQNIYRHDQEAPNLKHLPILSVLGNHDYCGDSPDMLLSDRINAQNWRLDDLVWTQEFQHQNKRIGLVFIDTNILAYYPNLPEWLRSSCAPMQAHFKHFEESRGGSGNLIAFVKHQTKQALQQFDDFDFIFVVGHHPVGGAACGAETGTVNEGGTDWLRKELEAYRVTGYLSGHVHSMDFGQTSKTLYASVGTSGTMPGTGCLKTQGWKGEKWEHSSNGFATIRIFGQKAYLSFYDLDGRELLTKSMRSRL